ncbi:hypothetical protein FHW00_005017, partial [Ochrobactrum sp. P6BSIII]|nr:hypothetical protein [Ochrobactrum sp. P6BSIII]
MSGVSRFFHAASALTMSVALVASGTAALSLASVNVAEAAVVSRIDV